jgi:hypothetical protein
MSKDKRRDPSKNGSYARGEQAALTGQQERRCDLAVLFLLLVLGSWLSFNYFGQKLIPSSDFPSFVGISRQILSGHAPVTYKRVPLHGMAVVWISHFIKGSNHPDLTAGWILNAVIYPFVGIFVYLIGKRFVGRLPAAMLAVIAAVNPFTLYMLRDPICEIHLLVWFLFAIYLMVIRSRWCYLVAGIATMVRYEAAGIIVCALALDVISTRDKKEWLRSLVCAAVASIPLVIWMTLTYVHGFQRHDTHYLNELGEYSGRKSPLDVFTKDLPVQLDLLWQVAYQPLLIPAAYMKSFFVRLSQAETQSITNSFRMLQFVACFTFLAGTVYAIIKRNWQMVAMIVFMVMYLMVHAIHSFSFTRFLTAVYWIALLVSCYGLQGIWRLLNGDRRIPMPVVWVVQAAFLCGLLLWTARLLWPIEVQPGTWLWPLSYMGQAVSIRSAMVPFAAIGCAALCAAAVVILCRTRPVWPAVVTFLLGTAILLSNQVAVATTIRNGDEDDEFKQVDAWYLQNAKPGERLACSMFMILTSIDEKNAGSFVPLSGTGEGSGDPIKSLELSYTRGITYVVWDSRLGLVPRDRYYWMNGLHDLTRPPFDLSKPRSVGPYEYLTTLTSPYTGRYVHIFRLKSRPAASSQ